MGVCENKILRTVSGCEREEVMGRLRKLYTEELHDMYFLLNIVRLFK